jgi:cell division septal protein FtsQ
MIKTVDIEGMQRISRTKMTAVIDEYRGEYWYLLPRNNILFFSETGLRQKIGQNYVLESLTVEKQYPRTLIIHLQEKQAQISWVSDDKCYQLDDAGQVLAFCEPNTQELISIKDAGENANSIAVGDTVAARDLLVFLLKAQQHLQEQLHPTTFLVHADGQQSVFITVTEGFKVYLNTEIPLDDQINRLYILLTNPEVKEKVSTLQYIDLRFGEKIYYQ